MASKMKQLGITQEHIDDGSWWDIWYEWNRNTLRKEAKSNTRSPRQAIRAFKERVVLERWSNDRYKIHMQEAYMLEPWMLESSVRTVETDHTRKALVTESKTSTDTAENLLVNDGVEQRQKKHPSTVRASYRTKPRKQPVQPLPRV